MTWIWSCSLFQTLEICLEKWSLLSKLKPSKSYSPCYLFPHSHAKRTLFIWIYLFLLTSVCFCIADLMHLEYFWDVRAKPVSFCWKEKIRPQHRRIESWDPRFNFLIGEDFAFAVSAFVDVIYEDTTFSSFISRAVVSVRPSIWTRNLSQSSQADTNGL